MTTKPANPTRTQVAYHLGSYEADRVINAKIHEGWLVEHIVSNGGAIIVVFGRYVVDSPSEEKQEGVSERFDLFLDMAEDVAEGHRPAKDLTEAIAQERAFLGVIDMIDIRIAELRASLRHFKDRTTLVGPEEVRYARKAMGFTRVGLATRLDVNEEYVRGIEVDKNTVKSLFRLAMVALLSEELGR